MKQYQNAIADYSEAIRLKPKVALAYSNRANSYDSLGKTTEAKLDRAKAEELKK